MRHFLVTIILFCGAESAQAKVVSNVHNAPGWSPNHAYTAGQRVNSGPGWDGTKFIPYQPLAAYQAAANCTSGSTAPTGTGTAIADGSCSWKYLSDTDYVTLTGWGNDAPAWTAQPYGFMEVVAAPDAAGILTEYRNDNNTGCGFPSPAPNVTPRACGYNVTGNCVSTVAPPTGSPGDNCTWTAVEKITYTSGKSFIPQQRRLAMNWAWLIRTQPYEADLWNDREYVLGQNGETTGHILYNHINSDNHNIAIVPGNPCGDLTTDWGLPILTCPFVITAAPGESFVDTLAANPSLPFNRNPANGVSIVGSMGLADWWVYVTRLQMYNPTGPIITGFGRDGDFDLFANNIMEFGTPSVGTGIPWSLGTGSYIANSAIITLTKRMMGYIFEISAHRCHHGRTFERSHFSRRDSGPRVA
jgi:hypothetical protein